ncbi:hypothetical protein B0H13DRAFT_857655 [Mycena leptocephala]|nr:hypothetical protein B0H13DRAFT_857655 [Mycena leptocephala]
MGMGGMMGGGMGMMGMEGMGMMGLNRDPRIAGEEGGMGMGIGGEEGMEGDATNMMLNMGMMNGDVGMLGLDGGMGMLGGGMGMMGMNMNMNMGMNMGPLGMIGGMPLPMGMGDVSGSGGGDSEARADTDADAEESDAGAHTRSNTNVSTLAPRRRGEDDMQTQQTPRAGVVRLPSPVPSSPGAGPSSASSSSAVYDEDGELDDEEGEVVVAIRGSGGGGGGSSGTVRRASTVRAAQTRPPLPDGGSTTSTAWSLDHRGVRALIVLAFHIVTVGTPHASPPRLRLSLRRFQPQDPEQISTTHRTQARHASPLHRLLRYAPAAPPPRRSLRPSHSSPPFLPPHRSHRPALASVRNVITTHTRTRRDRTATRTCCSRCNFSHTSANTRMCGRRSTSAAMGSIPRAHSRWRQRRRRRHRSSPYPRRLKS